MPTTTEKTVSGAADYQAFIASLELYTIGLAECSCKLNRDEYWKKDQEQLNSYKLTNKASSIEKEYFNARSTFTLDVVAEKSKTGLIHVTVTFDLHFHGSHISKDFVSKFCDSEIRLIVIPFFREYVTDVTARMHIPPVIIPLATKGE